MGQNLKKCFMPEEVQDVKTPEAEVSEATEPSTVEQQDSPSAEEPSGDENKIPHSRVKEMEKKAFSRGQQEALKKL